MAHCRTVLVRFKVAPVLELEEKSSNIVEILEMQVTALMNDSSSSSFSPNLARLRPYLFIMDSTVLDSDSTESGTSSSSAGSLLAFSLASEKEARKRSTSSRSSERLNSVAV